MKFLDESSVNTSMTRLYGRAAGGERVVESVPLHSGAQTTTLAVVGLTGLAAPLVLDGAVNGHVFHAYIEQCVAPTLAPGDILLLDNLPAHKVAGVEMLVQARGARLIYLPPYSSDFNPIELPKVGQGQAGFALGQGAHFRHFVGSTAYRALVRFA